jgi:hypothetical protein
MTHLREHITSLIKVSLNALKYELNLMQKKLVPTSQTMHLHYKDQLVNCIREILALYFEASTKYIFTLRVKYRAP